MMDNEWQEGEAMHGSWWSGHKVVDPSELETRFSMEDGLGCMDLGSEELSAESLGQLDRVLAILDRLPPCEADFIDLYYLRRRKQTDIAEIFGVSQPTVCYRLQRATARARYLISLPDILDGEIEDAMRRVLTDPLDIDVMVLMFETTCQSEVAKRLGISQGKVRHRFIRALERMDDLLRASEDVQELLAMDDDDRSEMFDADDDSTWREELQRAMSDLLRDPMDVDLVLHMATSGNVAAATRRWEITRRTVQRRYRDALDTLTWFEGLEKYINIFQKVSDNLNILREVQRPSNERITHVIT